MGIVLDGIFRRQRRQKRAGFASMQYVSTSGEKVTPDSLLALSAYYAAIRAISEDIAKVPLHIYRQLTPRGKEKQRDHVAWDLLNRRPNTYMTAMSLRETMTSHALGWGGGYAEIVRDDRGRPFRLFLLDPRHTAPNLTDSGELVYEHTYEGRVTRLPAMNVLHLHGLGWDGIKGYTVAQFATDSLGSALSKQRFSGSFFNRGLNVGGYLQHPAALSDVARDHLRESMEEKYSGSENAHRVMILEEGMSFKEAMVNPEDAQMLESQQFSVEDVARWFRMPPHKLQHLLRATYSNIEMENISYVVDTLTPWWTRWEQEIDVKLIGDEDDDIHPEHIVDSLLRGDMKARGDYYAKLFAVGAASPNDIRETMGDNPVENGDEYYVPSNMVAIDDEEDDEPEAAPPFPPMAPNGPPFIEDDGEGDDDSPDDADEQRGADAQAFRTLFAVTFDTMARKHERMIARTEHKRGVPMDREALAALEAREQQYANDLLSPVWLTAAIVLRASHNQSAHNNIDAVVSEYFRGVFTNTHDSDRLAASALANLGATE